METKTTPGANDDVSNSSYENNSSGSVLMDTSNATPSQIHSLHTLETKMVRARKRIQEEQRRKEANVEEYLKMAAVAQRNQLPQVKAVFEKRNAKAATNIAVLQRKLERYQRSVQTLELEAKLAAESSPSKGGIGSPNRDGHHGSIASGSSNTSKTSRGRLLNVSQGIKSVGGNLKDGITGISGTVISKPREIASYLMKQKFGSADNIPNQLQKQGSEDSNGPRHGGSAQMPSTNGRANNSNSNTGIGHTANVNTGDGEGAGAGVTGGSECSGSTRSSKVGCERAKNENSVNANETATALLQADLTAALQQLNDLREELTNLREDYETYKTTSTADSSFLCNNLQEERFKVERLEEQVNDLTELHQAETGNLKQALADAEEKLSYQSEERLRDLADLLDSCLVKISRLEQQQQQLVTIEGIENSNARALVVKLVNIGLTVLQLLLLLVATAASTLAPFMGSRIRLFASVLIGLVLFLAHRKWPHYLEIVLEFWTDFLNRL